MRLKKKEKENERMIQNNVFIFLIVFIFDQCYSSGIYVILISQKRIEIKTDFASPFIQSIINYVFEFSRRLFPFHYTLFRKKY